MVARISASLPPFSLRLSKGGTLNPSCFDKPVLSRPFSFDKLRTNGRAKGSRTVYMGIAFGSEVIFYVTQGFGIGLL